MILILVTVGAAWAVLTSARVQDWTDERRVWQAAVQHAPEKPRPWINLGRQYARDGADRLALEAYQRAIALSADPRRPQEDRRIARAIAEANLALLWHREGWTGEARSLIAIAVDRLPGDPSIAATAAWIRATP